MLARGTKERVARKVLQATYKEKLTGNKGKGFAQLGKKTVVLGMRGGR